MDMAADLETRLPRTRAAMAAGLIDADRARLIWRPTRHLTDADAARADEILAVLAPGLRYDQLARKAVAVAMKLDPEAFQRGKEKARADRQRVVAGREESGNAYLSGRELAIEDALASKAHIDALAVALRRGGLPGTLQQLRVLAFNDLTQGRDPIDRLTGPRPADPAERASQQAGGQPRGDADAGNGSRGDRRGESPLPGTEPDHNAGTSGGDDQAGGRHSTDAGDGDDDASWDGCPDMPEWQHERRGTTEDDGDDHYDGPGVPSGPPAPFPALINLTVPAGTAYGWSSAPGEAGGWGLTDPGDTRRLLQAASMHPRTRWCFTLLGPDGTAVAHGCARGQHPWIPPPDSGGTRDGPDQRQATALADFLRTLNVTLTPDRQGHLRPRQARKTATPPAASSSTSCAPAPRGAPHPAAAPRPCTATSTTPSPTPPGSPANATWPPPADATTDASKPPAGSSPSPSPASCTGPHPQGAATPPGPPFTRPDREWLRARMVTGTTGHLGRLTMERLLVRAVACGQCVVCAGSNRGRCPQGMPDHLTGR